MERYHVIGGHLRLDQEGTVTSYADAQATIAALEETILKMGENAAVVAKDAMAAKEQVAALQARVRELEARCQRAPLDHETVCHACDGSGWVERGY